MKTFLITASLGAALIAPAMAEQVPQSQIRQDWAARQHVYAAAYYARQTGNSNTNSDFQLVRER
jgi:opacity protein-like surface antigen